MNAILYYVHDPMCSWCWGFSKTLNELLISLPDDIKVQRLLGGLASDTDFPMCSVMQQQIKNNWKSIEKTIVGVKFNFDFWDKTIPRRSTYPSCRAVIAARKQGEEYDLLMTQEIQKAYYQKACNPSDNYVLIDIAYKLNLLIDDFKTDLISQETQNILKKEIMLSRELFAESFPSLILKTNNSIYTIAVDYNNSKGMLRDIRSKLV